MSTHVPAIAVILARAGSRGLPMKNHLPVAGRPCVSWTIDHARACGHVSRIGVSTDDQTVAKIASDANVEFWPRDAEDATPTARIDAAARSALVQADRSGDIPTQSAIVLLYANVPVRPANLIDRALALFLSSNCDSVQSYADVGKHHPTWTTRVAPDGVVRPWEGEQLFGGVYRRQNLEPAFVPDGGVIVVRRSCLDAAASEPGNPHAFLGTDHRGITTGPGEVIDIDNAVDRAVADAMLRESIERR